MRQVNPNTELTVTFDGQAVDDGEIDVRDLAPTLLAMGELIQTANEVLNGDKSQIIVRVRATQRGSFDAVLSLTEAIEHARPLLKVLAENKDGIDALTQLATLIFAPIGGGIAGLWAYLLVAKGRKPDKIEEQGGDIHYHFGDISIVSNPALNKLIQDKAVRDLAYKSLAALNTDGIESIGVRRGNQPKAIKITKKEVPYFAPPEEAESNIQETTKTSRTMVQIISLSFKEENKWRVTEGAETYTVVISDNEFNRRVARSEISFSKGDILDCDLMETQTVSSRGLKKEREIVLVHEHIPAPRQTDMF